MSRLSNQNTDGSSQVNRTAVRGETVAAEHAGRRIDNYLLQLLKPAPKGLIYKLLRSGQIRVNGGRTKPDYRLVAADIVRIPPVEARVPGDTYIPSARLARVADAILYEDERFLIIDKPAGFACHGGTGLRYGVIEIARRLRPQVPRLDLAHRLDRETSGCLILTKQVDALRGLHNDIRERHIVKRYTALLRGCLPAEMDHISAALLARRTRGSERRAEVVAGGKASETVIENRQSCGAHSLVQLRLITGRMHQIRAHAQHIGHPVAGDRSYGDPAFNRTLAELGLRRLFLHATSIAFDTGDRELEVEAPLPPELADVLTGLRAQS